MTTAALAQARRILQEVASEHGVTIEDLHGPRRGQLLFAARAHAVRRIRAETGLKQMAIGRLVGRHHSTISYHLNGNGRA